MTRLTVGGLSPSAVQLPSESRKQQGFGLAVMSAILGTSLTLGGSAKLRSCLWGFAGRRWPPGRRNPVPAPRLHRRPRARTVLPPFSLQAPQAPRPRQARLPAHALSYKEAAARQARGAAREAGGARLPRPRARAPRSSPAQPGPARPARPSALGPCSPPRRRPGGWWAPPRCSWVRPSWPPSGPEPSWTSPSPWRGRGAHGGRRRARGAAFGAERHQRLGGGQAATAAALPQPRSSRARAESARAAPGGGGAGAGRGRGWLGKWAGPRTDPAGSQALPAPARRPHAWSWNEGRGAPGCGPGFSSSEFAPNRFPRRSATVL